MEHNIEVEVGQVFYFTSLNIVTKPKQHLMAKIKLNLMVESSG
jgi:hypothetical protein